MFLTEKGNRIEQSSKTNAYMLLAFDYSFAHSRREQLLKVTSKDIKETASRYLLDQPSSHCILGDKE
jgi:Zn-dependent M16 (insulinase) family peptidase